MTHRPPHPAGDSDPSAPAGAGETPASRPAPPPDADPAPEPVSAPPPHNWPQYYDAIDGAPRDTLLRALARFEAGPPPSTGRPRRAIDLACGEGRDTAELIRRGWRVTAVDAHPEAIRRVLERPGLGGHPRLEVAQQRLEDIQIPPVDMVVASFALPFCPPERFDDLWGRITSGLQPGGRFCGQFFGDRDSWATIPDRSHHTRAEVEALLAGFDIEHFEEAEKDGTDALGVPKHWHVFHVVARRQGQSRQGQFGQGQ